MSTIYLYILWFALAILSAYYMYKSTSGKTQVVWTIVGLLLGPIGLIIWYTIGPTGRVKKILP